jgi:hypothetical protein
MLKLSHSTDAATINILRGQLEKFNARNKLGAHDIYPGNYPIEIKLWAMVLDHWENFYKLPRWFRNYKSITRRIIGGDIPLPTLKPYDYYLNGEPNKYNVFIKDWRKFPHKSIYDTSLEKTISEMKEGTTK